MKLNVKHVLCLIAIVGMSINLSAQTGNTVKGKIVELNKKGKEVGLPGANVYWLGTQTGTSTDEQGNFVVKSVKNSSKLVVSYIGYKNDTVTAQLDLLSLVQ